MLKTREQVVYIDVLFVINLIINYFILLAVSGILHRKDKRLRLLLGACIGAAYSLFIFFPSLSFLYTSFLKLLLSFAIVAAAYRFKTPLAFFKLVLCFYLVSFLFGGTVYALWLFFSPPGLTVRNGVAYLNISPVLLVLATSGCYAVLTIVSRFLHRNISESSFYSVEITVDGETVKAQALLDTGNELCDAISGLPVVIAEYGCVEKLIPVKLRPFFRKGAVSDPNAFEKTGWSGRLRMIPYGSVGPGGGLLPAFKPDKLVADIQSGPVETSAVLVAVSAEKLSSDGRYRMLMNPHVLAEIKV